MKFKDKIIWITGAASGIGEALAYKSVEYGGKLILSDIDEAIYRVKNYVAPINSMRLDKKTPCVKTSYCEECKSPDRICNTWTITEKSFPKGRVKVVLINEDLGL